jgi:hypothetical protein
MAPSLLFLFLNRAIALAPHLLVLKQLDNAWRETGRVWNTTNKPTQA